MDLLKLVQKLPSAPPLFKEEILDKFGAKVVLPQTTFPKGRWTELPTSHTKRLAQPNVSNGYSMCI